MDEAQIRHLAQLARIELTAEEIAAFQKDIAEILSYVDTLEEIVAGKDATAPAVGPVANVMREDKVTTPAGTYDDTLLAAMPETDNRYLIVKQILTEKGTHNHDRK